MARKGELTNLIVLAGGAFVIYQLGIRGSLGTDFQTLMMQFNQALRGIGKTAIPSGTSGSTTTTGQQYSTTSTVRHDGQLVLPVPPSWGWRSYPQYDPLVGKTGIYQTDDKGNFNGPIAWV